MIRALTAKQEAFCRALAAGEMQGEAYRRIYAWNGGRRVSDQKATEEAKKPHVRARIVELKSKVVERFVWTREQKLLRLKGAVDEQLKLPGKKQLTPEQLKAMELAAKLQGQNEPEKLKVTGLGSLLQQIRKAAPKP